MFNLKHRPDFRTLRTLVCLYSTSRKSHYEILKIRKNCSDKDIKEAFIKMSKEFHPDKNKDPNAQQVFVRIVEAYNVLGKPSSRAKYDHTTEVDTRQHYPRPEPYHVRRNSSYNYYYQRQHAESKANQQQENQPYYGVKGINKMPNYYIILFCFGFALIGSIMQAIVIREMYVVNRRQLYEKSKQLSDDLEGVRSAAKSHSNEVQTRVLLEKIVASANPTIATASLGQALANDKKEVLEAFLTEYGVTTPTAVNNYAECQGMTVSLYDVLRKAMTLYHFCRYQER